MDKIAALSKRRGFVFPGSDIYGGLANTWDYGPLGVELKRNVKELWWRTFVHGRRDIVGIDAGILMHPRVWEASGHVAGFNDPLVDCRTCKSRFRADHLIEERLHQHVEGKSPAEMSRIIAEAGLKCPVCGNATLTDARQFNMMFSTVIGPVEETGTGVYLRPETAQAMFVQFDNIATSMRRKLPFGIAQIGRAYRNEITPGNFIFRDRELDMMEMEYFVHPSEEDEWFAYWVDARHRWWTDVLGIDRSRLRLRPHDPDELSHYSKQTTDIEYEFPIGWSELEGVAARTDFDLKAHATASGRKLEIFDEAAGEHIVPYVIEPAMGVDRAVLTVLVDGYEEEQLAKEKRVVLRIRPELAPVKAAVLPLLRNRPELVERARALTGDLKRVVPAMYDDTASICKLYRRQDEIGTPFCVTVDVESLDDGAATIRERDTMTQERVSLDLVPGRIADLVAGRSPWEGVAREPTGGG